MKDAVRRIPATKWLLALPQLSSRVAHAHADVQASGCSSGSYGRCSAWGAGRSAGGWLHA